MSVGKKSAAAPLALIHAGQLVTVARQPGEATSGELNVIADGALLTDDSGLISWVGPTSALTLERQRGYTIVDAGGRVVLPGFVDAHTHPIFAGNRADEFCLRAAGIPYAELLARGDAGIMKSVRQTRAASEDVLFAETARRAHSFLRYGTTTIEAKSGYGLSTVAELASLRVLRQLAEEGPLRVVPTFLGAHLVPSEYRDDPDGYTELVANEMLPQVAAEKLADFCDVFCDVGAFTPVQSERILRRAIELGMGIRLHANELADSGGAALAARLGATSADHLIYLSDTDIQALAAAGSSAVLLPGTTLCLRSSTYAPARALRDAGVPLALATDCNPGTCNTENMALTISLALLQLQLTAEDAIRAATLGGARALRHDGEVGSLEVGKAADFVIYEAQDYREIPYRIGMNLVQRVYVGGQHVI